MVTETIVYLLVIISHGGSVLKLDECVPMPKPQATGRVVWWMQVADQYGFKCKDNQCTRWHYSGFAKTYQTLESCKQDVKSESPPLPTLIAD
jgi:hypothetical protein